MNPDWLSPPDLATATRAQREIAMAVERDDRIGPVRMVAGTDTSNRWLDSLGPIHAAIAPLEWPGARPLPPVTATLVPPFPYVSGYLGFREAPSLVAAWALMAEKPDLILVDGQGRAHPRRAGIACQLGVLLDVPAVGVAKSLLCGAVRGTVGPARGDAAALVDGDEVVGLALRTRSRATPVYISPGHRLSLETARDWVMKLCDGRRLPLTTRAAHDAANAARRAYEAEAAPAGRQGVTGACPSGSAAR